ncbi:beta-N-acetylhexosaminidase [Salaquimonas pukyongi]|uniref:beta-N-acetylhexosaminidase n=1 Tax=Salaquimonas pukyongi TaxID=2712698 RepID=UPI00096B6C0C|nr:beta-N-acetylhexosaminidase [Salaquimonas pukyongi]
MGIKAFITGVAGTSLSDEERSFIDHEHPWGLILFARNIEEPRQVHRLVDEFRESVGRGNAPVLIDQEGGRVQRLCPPHWEAYATARQLGDLWRHDPAAGEEAIRLHSRLIAFDLLNLGINVDCLPVLDVPVEGSHDIIGDRAYSSNPQEVAAMGRMACEGLLAGGVLPVVKHIPGHGRASTDSHLELPEVHAGHDALSATDFAPFKALADMPLAMTAHVRFHALDREHPATVSQSIITAIIRGEIGFDGLLMSDDLSMQALEGTLADRTEASIGAGCDMVLHCNGDMREMTEVASVCPVLEGRALERAENAEALLVESGEIDVDAARARYRDLLEPAV